MTIGEFYQQIGGGYEEMLGKFRADDRILRFLGMFQRDTSFQMLKEAMEKEDCQAAFAAAHTLKGVSMNLCLHDMIVDAVAITEALRAGNMASAKEMFPKVEQTYNKVMAAMAQIG